jgi:glycosyltransferase involved in cell wall biosynthesis
MHKFLIVLAYYNRPQMVLKALQSILEIDYPPHAIQLRIIDDGSPQPFPVENYIYKELCRTIDCGIVNTHDSEHIKNLQGGSRHGAFINEAIFLSTTDYFVILCDDDAIMPNYFKQANEYLNQFAPLGPNTAPKPVYAFSWVKFYDPLTQHYTQAQHTTPYQHPNSTYNPINRQEDAVVPVCTIDGSQMLCSTQPFKKHVVQYPYPQTRCLDAAIYQQLFNAYGPCPNMRIYGQYKAAFAGQMGNVENPY